MKENSEFKIFKLRLKIDLESRAARGWFSYGLNSTTTVLLGE